jgi:hypothetical protein
MISVDDNQDIIRQAVEALFAIHHCGFHIDDHGVYQGVGSIAP